MSHQDRTARVSKRNSLQSPARVSKRDSSQPARASKPRCPSTYQATTVKASKFTILLGMHPPFYLTSLSGAPELRVGLLLDTPVLPAAFAEVLQHIEQSNFARVQLVVYNADARERPANPPRSKPLVTRAVNILRNKDSRSRLLFALYQRWDRGRIDESQDPLRDIDCSSSLSGIESLEVKPITKRFVHRLEDKDIRHIRERNIDVFVRFGFNILRGDILRSSRYGVWSYHHGDNDYYRGGPAYFWELYEGNPISGAILQILTEELDAGRVLYKGFFATETGPFWSRNRVQPYWGASTFVIQKLHQLHAHGWDRVEAEIPPPAPYRGKVRIYTAPTNRQVVRWLGPLLVRKTVGRVVRAFREIRALHWMVGLRPRDKLCVATGPALDLGEFSWIRSPQGRFYADPFLFRHDKRQWLFFEDCSYMTQQGRIACSEVTPDGKLVEIRTALERPYHLSYPCVFCDNGEIYMIPETLANGTVELYRCVQFPENWEFVKILLHAPAVDTTIWIENGSYWLFVTVMEQRGNALQLWLFHSRTLTGKWTPHPGNPISTDIRNSRGAGAIYRREGKLVRPSQDCSGNYGRRFTLNEILVLNNQEYQERHDLTIDPVGPRNLIGTHTYGQLDHLEVIDGCFRLPRSRAL